MESGRSARGLMDGGVIYLRPEAYDPEKRSGRALLAHEVAHVGQRQRPPSPSLGAPGTAEQEASSIGRAFAAGHAFARPRVALPPTAIAAQDHDEDPNAEVQAAPPVVWPAGMVSLIADAFAGMPTQDEATAWTRAALLRLDGAHNYLGRSHDLMFDVLDFQMEVVTLTLAEPDGRSAEAARQLRDWIFSAMGALTFDSLTDAELDGLVTLAGAQPKTTLDAIKGDHPATWESWFSRIVHRKRANDGNDAALRLQSLMNPLPVTAEHIEQYVEQYRNLAIQLDLTRPGAAPPEQRDVNVTLSTPYAITSRGNIGGDDREVRAAKASPAEYVVDVQAFLGEQARRDELSELYFQTYDATPGDDAAKNAAAQQAVQARAQEILSENRFGVDCSGMVTQILGAASPEIRDTMVEASIYDNFDEMVRNNANVRALTSNASGGASGRYASRLRDLNSAAPGTMIQIGTGHIAILVRNDMYTLATLPADVSANRVTIVNHLGIANQDDTRVRVVKYAHSIDANRADDAQNGGQRRYENDNMPGPHRAWAVFPAAAADITDNPVWKLEPAGVNINFTGLYVLTQRQLVPEVP